MKTRVEMNGPVATIVLDDPGKKVNTLGREMLQELNAHLDLLARNNDVQAVVFRSAKESNFIAGADINELRSIAVSPQARELGTEAFQAGQGLMNRIEDFPKPVVAAIHGSCLGGGFELALACHGRVVSSDATTQIGLPELRLGIVPGFGGTVRLPKLAGLVRAMTALLTSKPWSGKQALKHGLADEIGFREQLPRLSEDLARCLREPGYRTELTRRRRKAIPLGLRWMELPFLRGFVFRSSRAQVMKKTHGSYPAPLCLIQIVRKNFKASREQALRAEGLALVDLLTTPVASNLIRIFNLSQEAKKQVSLDQGKEVPTTGIVGSGFMGAGIATVLTRKAGKPCTLRDTNIQNLGKAMKRSWDAITRQVQRRQIDRVDAQRQFNLLSTCTEVSGLRNCGLVLEAVPEKLELKRKVFAELETVLAVEAVIASNTSSLPIRQLSDGARHPERFIGMHFFSPAEVMPLVEVIAGKETDKKTIATTVRLVLAMGKIPVVVADSPGFLVNRILAAYMLQAAKLAEDGVTPGRVDRAALRFGMPVGPLQLIGEVGVEVMRSVLHLIQGHFVGSMAAPRWVGREDLAQAFTRAADGKATLHEKVIAAWVDKADPGYPEQDIEDLLYFALLNESVRCLEEKIVQEPGMLDLAMITGIGFPAFRGGPLREADARGLERVIQRMTELASSYGAPYLKPAKLLEEMAKQGRKFT